MNLCLNHFLVISLLMIVIMVMMILLGKKTIQDWQKSTPVECGFNPMSNKRLPFFTHFFLIAIIFLIFDIEIIIIMPATLTLKTTIIKIWLITSTLFVLVLILGLYHEWNNGMLSWTK